MNAKATNARIAEFAPGYFEWLARRAAAAAAAETRPPYFWVGADAESAADAEPAEPVRMFE